MSNSILKNMNNSSSTSQMQFSPEMIQQVKQFAKTVKGNPKDQVMRMVQQGVRSNEQLQQAMNMAKQLQSMFK